MLRVLSSWRSIIKQIIKNLVKKVKSSLSAPWVHVGGVEVWLHTFLTSALYGCEWPASHPIAFPLAGIPASIKWKAGRKKKKSLDPAKIRTPECKIHILVTIPTTELFNDDTYFQVGRDRLVGKATRYGLNGPGWNPGGGDISAPVQNGRGAHTASCTVGTGSLSPGESGQGVVLTAQSHLAPRLRKE